MNGKKCKVCTSTTPVKPFHERHRDFEPVHEQQIDHAASTEDELQRHGADKRRDDERQRRRGLKQQFAAELVARQQIGEGQRQYGAEYDDQDAAPESVPKRFAKQRAAKKIDEVNERETSRIVGKSDRQDPQNRVNDERRQ